MRFRLALTVLLLVVIAFNATAQPSSPEEATPSLVFTAITTVNAGSLKAPEAIAVASNGALFIADTGNHRIVVVQPNGDVSVLAGNGKPGNRDGQGAAASFNAPGGVAFDSQHEILFVADTNNNTIRQITLTGVVTTLAGTGRPGFEDGSNAQFHAPRGLAIDSGNNLYVADSLNHAVRVVRSDGTVTTIAGDGLPGFVDGDASTSRLHEPAGVGFSDALGTTLYVADSKNHAIRALSLETGVLTTLAGTGQPGGTNGALLTASFSSPEGISGSGTMLFVADTGNHQVRTIDLEHGAVGTLAGTGKPGNMTGSLQEAAFKKPSALILSGALVVADTGNDAIKIAVPRPMITSITPTEGSPSGGTIVRIAGVGFLPGQTTVRFGGADGTGVRYISGTAIEVTAPPGSGTVDVTVTTPGGTDILPGAFTYGPALVNVSVSPSSLSLTLGQIAQLNLTATYSDGTIHDVTTAALWSSSDPNVATVVAGSVRAIGAGQAEVTSTFSGRTNVVPINVTDVPLPPDPETIAPAIDLTVPTTFGDSLSFLYEGANAIQVEVAPDAIVEDRVAVVRGRVTTVAGTPLPAARVTVPGQPELGYTLTRADGRFDLALNGGGPVTIRFEKDGFLPIDRQPAPGWNQFIALDDVVMTGLDPQVTIIVPNAPAPQVARGSMVTDDDGNRQATVFFPAGTTGIAIDSDGSSRALTTMSVRATEFTVGPRGEHAMPATLPPTSAYTYCVELSVDEALDASRITFNHPVVFYVENFLQFPVGVAVPTGYYDRESKVWVPSKNGRVIQILQVADGVAQLDINGDGVADDAVMLADLGIEAAELLELGSLYAAGTSLWRVSMSHFTPWDHNWPWGLPNGSQPPRNARGTSDQTVEKPSCAKGSIIECQNMTLGEALPITGTPYQLHYRSDRVPGRESVRTLTIPLTGSSVPVPLKKVVLIASVGGQRVEREFGTAPNQSFAFLWDGKDAYGRYVQGRQLANVEIGYVYDLEYQEPAQLAASFAAVSGVPMTAARGRSDVILWQRYQAAVGAYSTALNGLGAWTLDANHLYDLDSHVLFYGSGNSRSADTIGQVIEHFAGGGAYGGLGDGGPANEATIGYARQVGAGADGSLYIADQGYNRVRKVTPDGVIHTVAGNGTRGQLGDGGAATNAQLDTPLDVTEGPDGSLYIAHSCAVRRVKNGIITRIAGTGVCGFSGDGGPATQAQVGHVYSVTVTPQNEIFIVDGFWRIRRIDATGVITTFTTTGDYGYGEPYNYNDVSIGPDGSLYASGEASTSGAVYRWTPDGKRTQIAGGGTSTESGIPATEAVLGQMDAIAVDSVGNVYTVDNYYGGIRVIGTDGIITNFAGVLGDGDPQSGDNGLALSAGMGWPWGVAAGPDGSVFVVDSYDVRVRRIFPPSPLLNAGELLVADGSVAYVFDSSGRHKRTIDTLTNVTLLTFSYDGNGYLSTITDADGLVTSIERDGDGAPVAIYAPNGQRTTLTLDGNGYLASVTNPAGEAYNLTYTSSGLLSRFTTPRSTAYEFSYASDGRLRVDKDPAGGTQTLTRTGNDNSFRVAISTLLGRVRSYLFERNPSGTERRQNTTASGQTTTTTRAGDGTTTVSLPNGVSIESIEAPDPRWGMNAPFSRKMTIRTPGGLQQTIERRRAVVLSDPANPLGLTSFTDEFKINGGTFVTSYDATARTLRTRTPLGRSIDRFLDNSGRVAGVQVPGIAPTTIAYDGRGNLETLHQGGIETTFTYDALDRLTEVRDALSRTVRFEYDDAGRVTKQILPDLREILFSYDDNGNVVSITPPGRGSHSFTYTLDDLGETYDPPDVALTTDITKYEYNLDRELTQVLRPDGKAIDLGYDTGGRLSTVNASGRILGLSYNSGGNLEFLTDSNGPALGYEWDGFLPTRVTWSGEVTGNVSWTYDSELRLSSETISGTAAVSVGYDGDSLVTRVGAMTLTRDPQNGRLTGTMLGSVTDQIGYDAFSSPASVTTSVGGSPVFAQQFTRDDVGRITSITENRFGATFTRAFTYDAGGRLSEVKWNGIVEASYTYDANGNRLTRTTTGGVETATYDGQDRLLTYDGATYAYTPSGELLSKLDDSGTTTYSYDMLGSLRTVNLSDGTVIEYVIDGQQRRVGKKVNGTLVRSWLYSGQLRVVAELDGGGVVISRFVYGSRSNVPDYMIRGGNTYRIVSDHLGSPRYVLDVSNGSIMQSMDYDEFGKVIANSNPGFQPFGFAGGLYDRDTGLTQFGARDYDPNSGRWTAKDPIGFAGGDSNLYGYVMNDPVNLIDPMGTDWLDTASNAVAGFGDTVSFGASRWVREEISHRAFGQGSGVDQCTLSYRLGQVGGVVWWAAFGGAIGDKIAGANIAETELGNLTVGTAEYKARLEGLSEAGKLAELGGVRGAVARAFRNVFDPAWWPTVARTTIETGPTAGGWGGVVGTGVGIGGAAAARAGCGCQ